MTRLDGRCRISRIDSSVAPAALAGVLLLIFAATQGQAQTFTVLHDFTGDQDGANPVAGLVTDRAGNLYGTTANGGSGPCNYGCGVVWEITP